MNLENDSLEFGKAHEEWQINIWSKSCGALSKHISSAVATIDWDDPNVLSSLVLR